MQTMSIFLSQTIEVTGGRKLNKHMNFRRKSLNIKIYAFSLFDLFVDFIDTCSFRIMFL